VIHMKSVTKEIQHDKWMDRIEFVTGKADKLHNLPKISAWTSFDERIISFLNEMSNALIKERRTKNHPDIVSLAFWIRRSNVQYMRQNYPDCEERLGKGVAYHIAPANVALSFTYSLVVGLLAGNINIVRLSSRHFDQAEIFCSVLNSILEQDYYQTVAERIFLVKYEHDKEITDALSSICNMRIVWGGDATIATIRLSPIQPRTTEVTFANRFSICLINADTYLFKCNPKKIAYDFFLDTYLTDQNACSSPRIIFWFGKKTKEAQDVFWSALYEHFLHDYTLPPVITVDKLVVACRYASANNCRVIPTPDYKLLRVRPQHLSTSILDNLSSCGFFYEYDITAVEEILPVCTRECQTLSYIGFDKSDLKKVVLENTPFGIDRIVPVGHTMDFGMIWDGVDLIRELTRVVVTK